MSLVVWWIASLLLANPAANGPWSGVEARLHVEHESFELELYTDLDALLLGMSPASPVEDRIRAMTRFQGEELDVAIKRLKRYLDRRIRVRFDGEAASLVVVFPRSQRSVDGASLSSLGGRALLRGTVPARARSVSFFASRSFGAVRLTVRTRAGSARQLLEPGEKSAPVRLGADP